MNRSHSKRFRFNGLAFVSFISIFVLEVVIALKVHDRIIRPLVGDVLVVVMLFALARSFWTLKSYWLGFWVWGLAVLVEVGQYFRVLDLLGLGNNPLAKVVFGSVFDEWDLVAYTVGAAIAITIDSRLERRHRRSSIRTVP